MKKLLFLGLVVALFLSLNSCKKDDAPVLGANVNVNVKNLVGTAQKGVTVYMFKDQEVTSSTKMSDAKKQVITDDNGLAEFYLNFTELNILEAQTSLYFAVFYTIGSETHVAGSTGITVRRNDTKNISLTIPL